jgi:6-phosphogluconolactonase (cycloisomerase 2 family)
MLIGGYTPDKGTGTGITRLDGDEIAAITACPSPSWIARHPALPVLYAVAEQDQGGVAAWALVDGVPGEPLGTGATGGGDPCHLAVDASGRFLVTVNYTGGSVAVHRLGPDGSLQERTDLVHHGRHGDLDRQESAHPHMVRVHGDELLIPDLGGDAVYRYALNGDGRLTRIEVVDAPHGTGPRHLLPHGDRFYVIGELTGHVLVYDAGWRLRGAVPTTEIDGERYPSELVATDTHLYVANRGPNTIAVFALDRDLPRYLTEVPTGDWPRHIARRGDTLWAANERSHEITVHHLVNGIPEMVDRIVTPSPTCVLP